MLTLILLMVRSKSLSFPQVFRKVYCAHSLVLLGVGDEADRAEASHRSREGQADSRMQWRPGSGQEQNEQ